jgi:hypothetical protein
MLKCWMPLPHFEEAYINSPQLELGSHQELNPFSEFSLFPVQLAKFCKLQYINIKSKHLESTIMILCHSIMMSNSNLQF